MLGFKFWTQDIHLSGYYEDLTKFPCKDYRLLNFFVQVGLIVLIRVLFAYFRLYQTRRMLSEGFSKKDSMLIWFLVFGICTAIILTEVSDDVEDQLFDGHNVCWFDVPPGIEVM